MNSSAAFPPWWHEGTANLGEVLVGVVRDQRDFMQGGPFPEEFPVYEIELLEPATLTVGETVDKEWTVATRKLEAGDMVAVRARVKVLMMELTIRGGGVDNGERVKIGFFGKKDPARQDSPYMFKVRRLDRPQKVNREKYARELGVDAVTGVSPGSPDLPADSSGLPEPQPPAPPDEPDFSDDEIPF
jgi:hypothetical protein